jgi:hypothetical protein
MSKYLSPPQVDNAWRDDVGFRLFEYKGVQTELMQEEVTDQLHPSVFGTIDDLQNRLRRPFPGHPVHQSPRVELLQGRGACRRVQARPSGVWSITGITPLPPNPTQPKLCPITCSQF